MPKTSTDYAFQNAPIPRVSKGPNRSESSPQSASRHRENVAQNSADAGKPPLKRLDENWGDCAIRS